jgi:glycosyltransferase involved in cell wall biosynthesis
MSDRGVLPELVGRNDDLVFPAGQPSVLAERLLLWMKNGNKRSELANELQQKAQTMHSASEMTMAYERVFSEVLAVPGSRETHVGNKLKRKKGVVIG